MNKVMFSNTEAAGWIMRLAAAAPPVPDWFKPTMPMPRPSVQFQFRSVGGGTISILYDTISAAIRHAERNGHSDEDVYPVGQEAADQWDQAYKLQRLLQWPAFYGRTEFDLIMKELG